MVQYVYCCQYYKTVQLILWWTSTLALGAASYSTGTGIYIAFAHISQRAERGHATQKRDGRGREGARPCAS